MAENHPYHSDDTFVKGENPIQEFVSPALEMGPEERARPRYGRPPRKSQQPTELPKTENEAPPTT